VDITDEDNRHGLVRSLEVGLALTISPRHP
jgi:hypothetical protein